MDIVEFCCESTGKKYSCERHLINPMRVCIELGLSASNFTDQGWVRGNPLEFTQVVGQGLLKIGGIEIVGDPFLLSAFFTYADRGYLATMYKFLFTMRNHEQNYLCVDSHVQGACSSIINYHESGLRNYEILERGLPENSLWNITIFTEQESPNRVAVKLRHQVYDFVAVHPEVVDADIIEELIFDQNYIPVKSVVSVDKGRLVTFAERQSFFAIANVIIIRFRAYLESRKNRQKSAAQPI